MRFEFSQIALQDALEHVVLGADDQRDRVFKFESSTATALLDGDEPVHPPCAHVEHDAAD